MGAFEDAFEIKLELGESASWVDPRPDDLESKQVPDPDQHLFEPLARCDEASVRLGTTATIALIRIRLPENTSAVVKTVASRRIPGHLEANLQPPEFALAAGEGDYAIALMGLDAQAASAKVRALVTSLAGESTLAAAQPSIWAGVATVGSGDCREALRTARLACELASFQASGHVELIDL